MNIFLNLYKILNKKQKIGGLFQLLLMIASMFMELLSIGMLIPIISIISSDDLNKKYPFLSNILQKFGATEKQHVLIYVMLLFIFVYTFKMLFMTFVTWVNYKYVFSLQIYFSEKLFKGYLSHPITFHMQKNSAQLIQNTINLVSSTTGVLVTVLSILTEIITATAIVILLFKIQPVGFMYMCLIFIPAFILFQIITKKNIIKLGKAYQNHEGKRIQYLQQGISAVKDIKVLGREEYFIDQYKIENSNSARSYQKQQTLQALPRFYLEFLAVLSIGILIIQMAISGKEFSSILTTLGLFGGAAFRLMPSLNRIAGSVQLIRFSKPVLETLRMEFHLIDCISPKLSTQKINFFNQVVLENISFTYPNNKRKALENVSLTIPKGKSVGIIGTTGVGKSTLVDIILGLLTPQSGCVKVDNVNIECNLPAWQSKIGYVPQVIQLIDDTLRKNIAFGVNENEINELALVNAIKSAQIEDLINNQPNGLETTVGERGIRLSGGERQRIGIARALYHNPAVLVLDEATSSLDVHTEQEIMKSVNALSKEKTIIIVAHRLTTIEKCDFIYKLEKTGLYDKTSNFKS